ncbi:MAG: hypothetical protein ACE5IK_13225 [Acidobacteriota bacterium]
MRARRLLIGLGVMTFAAAWCTSSALAIPAFARKYQTSCATCHVAFPNLTPFGEAFRLNGYRFPEGGDESMSKDNPVSMGAEGYKKMWPKAIWPGSIPGQVPLSVVVESEIVRSQNDFTTSFDGLGGEVALLTAGTYGEHISFYGEVEFARADGGAEVELERVNTIIRPFTQPNFQIKVGAFEPGVFLVSNHRRLTDHKFFALGHTVGDNDFALEPFQQGVEFFGVVKHRLLYNTGFVEGSGNAPNNGKDIYARVAYKFGGLRLDGTTPESGGMPAASNPKPWSEKSLTISAFGYRGRPLLSSTDTMLVNDPLTNIVTPVETTMEQDDIFDIYGGDISWKFLDLGVSLGAANREDDSPFLSDPTMMNIQSQTRFAEVDWVILPWLIPAARYDSASIEGTKTEQISVTINILARANLRAFVAANAIKEDGGNFHTDEIVVGAKFGF